MKIRNKAIPAVYAIFEKDGKYLIARRCNTGYQDGNYQVPAGHVEMGELPTEALIREVKEEIGVDIRPENIEIVHISYRPRHDKTDNRIDLFFRVRKWGVEIKNMEPDKCDDLRWVAVEELPANMTPHVREAFEAMVKGRFYTELGLDFLKSSGFYKIEE